MILKIEKPKTVDEVQENIKDLTERTIGKDILKDVSAISDTSITLNWLSSNSAGIEAVVNELRTAVNKLIANIQGQ